MTRRFPVWLVLFALALALGASLALAPVVAAHAQLRMSVPPANATVPLPPAAVVLTFSEETSATKSGGSVTDASGATVSTGFQVDLNDRTKMIIALKPGLGPGVYTVKWNSFTEDDNGMLNGTFSFTVATGNATGGTAAPAIGAATGATPLATQISGVTLVPGASTPSTGTTNTPSTGGGGVPAIVWAVIVVVLLAVIAFVARAIAAGRRAP